MLHFYIGGINTMVDYVIAGFGQGQHLKVRHDYCYDTDDLAIMDGIFAHPLSTNPIHGKEGLASYNIISQTNNQSYSASKGLLGGALFGGAGLLFGVNGKKQNTYTIECTFLNGKKSTVILSEKMFNEVFLKSVCY